MVNLQSCLAASIQRFIDLRRLSGTDYHSQTQLLGYFDRFAAEQQLSEPRITPQITQAYQHSLSRLAPRTQHNRFGVLRQLCQYLAASDPLGYVPEPLRIVPAQALHRPYIFRLGEVRALLAAAASLPPPDSLRPHTYRTLLGLLYSTGIRIGEALALNRDDFHGPEQRLYVAAGKFRKARWIPLTPSTCGALTLYLHRRSAIGSRSPDAPLFVNLRARRVHYSTVNHDFHRLLARCAIAYNKHTGPRLHDLRHSFAVARLLAWYQQGRDVNACLPALATYMGHVNIRSTQLYLRPTTELLAQVNERFHNHYLNNVKPQGG